MTAEININEGRGFHRAMLVRIPRDAATLIANNEENLDLPLHEALTAALHQGIQQFGSTPDASIPWRAAIDSSTFKSISLTPELRELIAPIAESQFGRDFNTALAWLIARGAGLPVRLPSAVEPESTPVVTPAKPPSPPALRRKPPFLDVETPSENKGIQGMAKRNNLVAAGRRIANSIPDDEAPSPEELIARREALGLSQRDLAEISKISRGYISEVERGKRKHVPIRLRISAALAALEKSR